MCHPFDLSIQLCRLLSIRFQHTVHDPNSGEVLPGGLGLQLLEPWALLDCQGFFFCSDFFATLFDAFAHFLQGFSSTGGSCLYTFFGELGILSQVVFISGYDISTMLANLLVSTVKMPGYLSVTTKT
jgi:hypothetical protein